LPADVLLFAVVLLNLRILSFYLPGGLDQDRFNRLHLYPSHLRMDALACGVFIAYLRCYHAALFRARVRRWKPLLWISGLALVSPAFIWPMRQAMATWGLTSLYLGYGLLLAVFLHAGRLPRGCVILAKLGVFSYCIYLFHVDVFQSLENAGLDRWPYGLRVAAEFSAEIAAGVLLAKLIEIPTLRLRDKIFPPRRLAHGVYSP
jgi:peptidoglycan/LPS O-acetylase OafA/YrhL